MKELGVRREQWREELTCVRRMHSWVVEAEAMLSGSWLAAEEALTNVGVAARFDAWVATLKEAASRQGLTDTEQRCVRHCLHGTASLRPQLIQCYAVPGVPRTNNDREGFIRAIKARDRRVSGRKTWNRYVLRDGRRVAYSEAQVRSADGLAGVQGAVARVPPRQWRRARAEQRARQADQLTQYRFRHKRAMFLERLQARWAEAAQGTGLLP